MHENRDVKSAGLQEYAKAIGRCAEALFFIRDAFDTEALQLETILSVVGVLGKKGDFRTRRAQHPDDLEQPQGARVGVEFRARWIRKQNPHAVWRTPRLSSRNKALSHERCTHHRAVGRILRASIAISRPHSGSIQAYFQGSCGRLNRPPSASANSSMRRARLGTN